MAGLNAMGKWLRLVGETRYWDCFRWVCTSDASSKWRLKAIGGMKSKRIKEGLISERTS